MRTNYLTLIAAAFLVSACQTGIDTSKKNAAGGTMHLSQWKSIKPHELIINIADLDGIVISKPESRNRDNRLIHQQARFDGGGGLFLEHAQGIFSEYTTNDIDSRENARAELSRYYKKRNQKIVRGEEREISSGDRGGWMTSVVVQNTGQTCILARVGFLGDTAKGGSLPGVYYDTIVRLRNCSGKRSMDDVEAFLKGMKLVEPEYNLMMFRRAGQ